MPQLNAFVGYSFAKEDEDVVRDFHTLLDSIKTVMPAFRWDHAEAAEPKVLSAKVREKMKGKNLFIGICTARERTVQKAQSPPFFASLFLPNNMLVVEHDSVDVKTADWIIQEIAYSLGCNMDLIILLEEGVRPPGGLQGDFEYIYFNRANPGQCLKKLSSMLSKVSPKPMSAVESPEMPAAGESPDVPLGDFFLESYLSPDQSWTAGIYVSRLRLSILLEKSEIQEKISDAFRDGPFYQEEGARVEFEAARISERARTYKEDWIEPLHDLVTKHPGYVGPYLAFGERFAAAGEYERAAENYELAARHSAVPNKVIDYLIEAAAQRAKAKQPEIAEKLLRHAADSLRALPEHEADGLGQMSYVWKELGKTDLFLACAERCLELAPDRVNPRFAIAHRYSELNLDAEALFHYRQYLLAKDDPGAWNNLGVAAATLKLPVTAVDSYLRSDTQGNTLATSNLAFNKLEAGFVEEAMQLCGRGLKAPEPDARLYDALAKCKRAREEEAAKESDLLAATKVQREVLRAMGKSSLLATPDRFHGSWKGPHCELAATIDGSRVVLKGTYERQPNTLGGLMGMGSFFANTKSETVTVEYTGEFCGEAFVGKVKTSTPSTLPNTLSVLGDGGSDCIGFLDSNATQLVILEGKKRYILSALGAGA